MIDRSGRFVIPPQFDDSLYQAMVTEFSRGLGGVTLDGRFGYINRAGSFAIGPSLGKGQPFRGGIAELCDSTRCGYIYNHGNRIGLCAILPFFEIPLVANAHPF